MLLSATFPLNVRIILLDTFPNGSSSYVACVCNHCCQKNHNRSIMSLTSPVSCLYDALSSYRFGRNSFNGSVEWLGLPDFLGNYEPPWNFNLLATYTSWGDRGSSNNTNWDSQPRGGSDSISVPWNLPVRVLPVYQQRVFENIRSAARHVCDDLLRDNCMYRIQSPSNFRNPIRICLVNQRYAN